MSFQPLSILLDDGLLTSDGEVHGGRRRLLAPMFHRPRVAGFGDQFVAAAERHSAGWRDSAEIDIHQQNPSAGRRGRQRRPRR